MSEPSTLIFLHVPKTAGSTFSSILARLYPESSYSIYNLATGVADFQQLPTAQRASLALLQGHFAYGIHQYIPRPTRYITFLRHPLERVVSLFYYFQRERTSYLHRTIAEQQITLADFVKERLTSEMYNFQVRSIAGANDLDPASFPTADESTLALAKQRLAADFTAFGLTERFNVSLVTLSHALGWPLLSPTLYYQSQNVAPERRPLATIAPETLQAIRENNLLDLELYDYAVKLFDQRWRSNPQVQLQFVLFQLLRRAGLKYRQWRGR